MDYMTISEAATKWNYLTGVFKRFALKGGYRAQSVLVIVGSFQKTQKSQWMPE